MKIHTYKITGLLLIFAVMGALSSCGGRKAKSTDETELSFMVFAGAGMSDAVTEIIDSFETRYLVQASTNLASSGTLARQIEQGASPNVFIAASTKWADYVDSLGFVVHPYKETITKNSIVLIAPKDSQMDSIEINNSLDLIPLLGDGRLSMGNPQHVPAGEYAKQSLEYYGWYEKLNDKILPAKDVRSALMVVELGEAPLGIVYKTDALKSEKVKIIGTFPEESHVPINFVSMACSDDEATILLYNYLKSEEASTIWKKYGFN